MKKIFFNYVLIVLFSLFINSIQASEKNIDLQNVNIVSGDKSSGNGAKIMKFLQKKRKRDNLPLENLELNMQYMSSDSGSDDDRTNQFYRSVEHNLNTRREALKDKNKFQHHILSRLYENIEPIYKSKRSIPTSYSFKIPSPFGTLTLVLQKCQKDEEHSFYLDNEKFFPFQTFVSHGPLESNYGALENEFNSMNLKKRKSAIKIIDEYLNLQCDDSDFEIIKYVSDNEQNIIEFSCKKINDCSMFNKQELSCLRTVTAIIGFSEPLRIHDGGKTMRALIRYNKLIFQ